MKQHPVFVPFGFRDAPEEVLRKLAYPPERGSGTTQEHASSRPLAGILNVIMKTVVSSGRSRLPASPPSCTPRASRGCPPGDADDSI